MMRRSRLWGLGTVGALVCACGGNVVVDPTGTAGGGGSTGSTSSTSETTTTVTTVTTTTTGVCAPGTCMLGAGGPCEAPTGPQGNGCCQCTGDSCSAFCECASPDTPIATPEGERPIASLTVGDLVYSVDHDQVTAVRLVSVQRVAVEHHRVSRVRLANGATLEISGWHPTAEGTPFAALRAGETLDGVLVLAVDDVPYAWPFTYDILPDSDTGTYYAGGVLIGSTMRPPGGP